jgi:RNA polymerase sigma-70 factor (ECF subfamily)
MVVRRREAAPLQDDDRLARFEEAILPHLGAAYNLARWLTRDAHDADDVVQEAYLRALQFFAGFHGTDGRAWLLAIVRNTCYTWLERKRGARVATPFDEDVHGEAPAAFRPEAPLLRREDAQLLRQGLEELPAEFREVIVLRELEDLSYRQIADVAGIPIGTVMSRLARARERLQQWAARRTEKGP